MSIVLQSTGGGSVTINEPTTASNFTQTLPASTGTVMVSGNMPAFSAYSGVSQSLTNNTGTKVAFNGEQFDTANCFDSTTNYRFTPNVAGYYWFTTQCNYSVSSSGTRFLTLYKNGSAIYGTSMTGPNALNYANAQTSALIYLNGSTDYVEVYASQNSGGTLTTAGNTSEVFFMGYLVRSA